MQTVSAIEINTINDLLEALQKRVSYFHEHGCRVADHGLMKMPACCELSKEAVSEFAQFIKDPVACFSETEAFAGSILLELCKMYHAKEWVQQFHVLPIIYLFFRLCG